MPVSPQLESVLQTALAALCARTFPDVAPSGTPTPYVVWHMYGGQAVTYTEAQTADRRNAFVQINVWDASRSECNALALQIEQVLTTHQLLQAEAIGALTSAYDEDTDLRGAMQDFSLWAER